MEKIKKNIATIILVLLILWGLYLRLTGLSANYSFWSDENHVAIFVRAILEKGEPVLANGFSTGASQWLFYYLGAFSAKIFGLNEFALRFPAVIFGTLTIWAVYLLGKSLFGSSVGLTAAAMTTFLKLEILWSRQARPYQVLQFFFLIGAWFLYKLSQSERFDWRYFSGFLASGLLASLIHGLGLVIFPAGLLYLAIVKQSWFLRRGVVLAILLITTFAYLLVNQAQFYQRLGAFNNLFYYRVFLWHNYPLLVLAAGLGIIIIFLRKEKSWQIPLIFLFLQMLIVSFILPKTFLRYFYIVSPFLLLLAAKGLWEVGCFLGKRQKWVLPVVLLIFSWGMGDKLAIKPIPIYSLNADMQEIPEVDWKKLYGFVSQRIADNPDVVLITNWNDLPIWHLGEDSLDYWIRRGEKFSKDPLSGAEVIPTLEGFAYVVKENEKGLIVLDSWDDFVPEGIREYAQNNLQKELEVDRLYPIQLRYWPVAVYSWGLEN